MSKAPSGLFFGTKGERTFYGEAERIIANRVLGLNLREHPLKQIQLSPRERKRIQQKIINRTATQEEYKRYEWDKRFTKRRRNGVKTFGNKSVTVLSAEKLEREIGPRNSGKPYC